MLLALSITAGSIAYLTAGLLTGFVSALSFTGDGSNNSYYKWLDKVARSGKIQTGLAMTGIVLLWPIHVLVAWICSP
jgi:hypothetical protein